MSLGLIASAHVEVAVETVSAVRLDASNDQYIIFDPGLSGDITICAWVYITTDRDNYTAFYAIDLDSNNFVSFGTNSSGITSTLNTKSHETSGPAFTVGAWYFTALVYTAATGSNNIFYIGDAIGSALSVTTAAGNDTIAGTWTFHIGSNLFNNWLDGRIAQVKVWTAALSQADIEAEREVDGVVRTSNLWAYYSFRDGPQTTDESGNGHTLTTFGAPTEDTDGPPVEEPPTTVSAVHFEPAANQYYSRSASGLNSSTSVTFACWVKLTADRDNYATALAVGDGGSNYVLFGAASNGTQFYLSGSTGGASTSFNFTVDTWTYIAFTIDRTADLDYIYHAEGPSTELLEDYIFSLPTGWSDGNTFYIGSDSFGTWLDASIAQVKIWTAALTETELEAEMYVDSVVRTSNLWAYYSFRDGPQTNDESGNSRTITAVGTLTTDTDGPPVEEPPAEPGMSIGFPGTPGSTHELIRTSFGLSGSVTICGWYYHNAPRTFGMIFGLMNSTSNYDYPGFSTTANQLYHITTGPETAGPTLTTGQWYYIALAWDSATGTDDRVYYAAAASSTMTAMTLTDSPDTLGTGWAFRIGNNAFNDSLNGRVAQVRVYSALLSQAEIEAEKPSTTPVRTSNLYAWYPLDGTTDITDHSGNGRDLTATGTLTTEEGPPIV